MKDQEACLRSIWNEISSLCQIWKTDRRRAKEGFIQGRVHSAIAAVGGTRSRSENSTHFVQRDRSECEGASAVS